MGAGSKSRPPAKSIDSLNWRSRLANCKTDAAIKVPATPHIETEAPHTIPPRAIAPCADMITVAFILPLAQLGIARWPATQSSEAAIVHAQPANPAAARNRPVS